MANKMTESHKKAISKALKGINTWSKGRSVSEKTKQKLRDKRASEKTKLKMSKAQIKRYDRMGRKKHKRHIHACNDKKYKQWRSDVFQRDSWTCQTCGKKECYLESHHIKSWAKYLQLRYDITNGVTLCRECHKLTRKGRVRK